MATNIDNPKTSATVEKQITLPYWDANEINRRLDENAKFIAEWNSLLDKNDRMSGADIVPPADLQRHMFLKRKLHENLGILAKMVQYQLKHSKKMDNPNTTFTAASVGSSQQPPV